MFNSKIFFVIVFLTALVLGAVLYLQVDEMMQYKLLTKLDKQYLSGTFTGGAAAAPAEEDTAKKDDESEEKADDTAKKDDNE